jgi:hypothetical protein
VTATLMATRHAEEPALVVPTHRLDEFQRRRLADLQGLYPPSTASHAASA